MARTGPVTCCPGFTAGSDGSCDCTSALACDPASATPRASIADWNVKKGRLVPGFAPHVFVGHPNYVPEPVSEASFWHRTPLTPSYELSVRFFRATPDDVGQKIEVKNAWFSLILARDGTTPRYRYQYYEASDTDWTVTTALGLTDNEVTLIQDSRSVQACANGVALRSFRITADPSRPPPAGQPPGLELYFTAPSGYRSQMVLRDVMVESPRARSRIPL